MKKHHRTHLKKHDRGEEINPNDEDETITQLPQANAKETRSKNNENLGRVNDESSKEEEVMDTEDEDSIATSFSTTNAQDEGLKVKNMNELMASPIKGASGGAINTNEENKKEDKQTKRK